MDQSTRYANLDLTEEDLIAGGQHILCAYRMKPKSGSFLAAAAHFAAESSTGTNVEVATTDDFTKGLDAIVYHVDEATEEVRIAYPLDLFDRNMIDGRMMLVSFLTLTIGNNQGMGDIEYAKMSTSTCRGGRSSCSTARRWASPSCGGSWAGPLSTAATSPARSSSRSWACGPSRSRRPPTSSGWVGTSSRTTSPRATRCSRP